MLHRTFGRLASGFVVPMRRSLSTKTKFSFDVTDATIQKEVFEASHQTPVVLDCWAEWCRPCKMLAPILEDAVAEHNGSVLLAKMSVDENRSVPVEAIPAVFGYSKGKVVSQFVGGQSSAKVKEFVKHLIDVHNKSK